MSNINDALEQQLWKTSPWKQEAPRSSTLGSLFSVDTLKQAASRIANARRSGILTRDLVGLLVTHASRNRRLSQPPAVMRMTLPVNQNKVSVRLTIQR